MDWGGGVTTLGTTTLKDRQVSFGIKDHDRTRHLCILGRTGSGRGELVAQMALQDIARGAGVLVLDATGNVTPLILERLEAGQTERLVFLDPADAEYPYVWNPLSDIRILPEGERLPRLRALLRAIYNVPAGTFLDTLAELLLARPDTTLASFYFLVTDAEYRKFLFGEDAEAAKKIDELLTTHADLVKTLDEHGRYIGKDTLIRNLIGQKDSKFTLGDIPKGKIVIVDFSKMRMFPTRMSPLVRIFVATARAVALHSSEPVPIYLHDCLRYLDDEEIEHAFSDTRVAITIADTMIQEADKERREKALARCGSVASFTTHPSDRSLIERAFYPYADPDELSGMEQGEMIVALTIDAVRTKAFFAKLLSLGERKSISSQDLMVAARSRYARSRTDVDLSFKIGKKGGDDKSPKDGSFSDAFRNIFAKRAGAAGSAVLPPEGKTPEPTTQPATGEKKPTQEKPKESNTSTPPPPTPEVPEADLKAMIYVTPVSV